MWQNCELYSDESVLSCSEKFRIRQKSDCIQKSGDTHSNGEPESMSMFNDIDWTRKGNVGICFSNSEKVKEFANGFSQGHSPFFGPGDEKKWYGTLLCASEGMWNSTAIQMVERFKDTGHPVFKSTSALSRGILKRKNNNDTLHFNADASNTELLFRIIHSVNQLSIYGAVSNWCEQFGWTDEEKGQEKQRESVITRSESFCIFSKTSIWKQFTEKHSGLRISVRDNSIHKGLRSRNFRASGCIWCELQNQT